MKNHSQWESSLFELIRRTSVDLPSDVEQAIKRAYTAEPGGSRGRWVLETILENIRKARNQDAPICQDTGTLCFSFQVPVGFDTNALAAVTRVAVAKATRMGYLRQNTIDTLSGESCPTNVAHGSPVFRFEQCARSTVDVRLIRKGGGPKTPGGSIAFRMTDSGREGIWRASGNVFWTRLFQYKGMGVPRAFSVFASEGIGVRDVNTPSISS